MHIQEPEPVEFTLLDELISNLTLSDEESLGLCEYSSDAVDFDDADHELSSPRRRLQWLLDS